MAMFGNREPLNFGRAPSDDLYGTQPIGLDQILQGQIPADPRIAQTTKPDFFGKGGDWTKVLGTLGDALQIAGGGRATYAPAIQQEVDQQRQRQQELQNYQMQRRDKLSDMLAELQYKRENPELTTLQQNTEYAYSLPEGDPRRQTAIQGVQGYANSPEVMAARQAAQEELARQRFGYSAALKGVPTYSATHPSGGGSRGLTPTARAKYMADAQAAIARGADPAKVHARLQQIGVE
jgi:hypothetical protein